MLKTKIWTMHRVLRIAVGVALLLSFALAPRHWFYFIGTIPFATGLVGTCPICSALGIDTCRARPEMGRSLVPSCPPEREKGALGQARPYVARRC